ncbi:acyl-coenzyme A oxidase, putative [Medicago truncatula]|uniref:Acyl-coenzyme A oxidase, putative n=2 Tax=Medicago truncatula TaxID=3880 RepID=G7IMR6_MEDTR|nr:acyl-coenzyme A oxidase, putative [Medicago truncatula]
MWRSIVYLLDRGVFRGWLTGDGLQEELRKLALQEVIGMYDHSLTGVRKPLLQSSVKPSNETNHQSYSSSFFVSIQTVIEMIYGFQRKR